METLEGITARGEVAARPWTPRPSEETQSAVREEAIHAERMRALEAVKQVFEAEFRMTPLDRLGDLYVLASKVMAATLGKAAP